MYLLAELVAEGGRAILVLFVLVIVSDDDATALRKCFHHELQRFLVSKDLFALLLELGLDFFLRGGFTAFYTVSVRVCVHRDARGSSPGGRTPARDVSVVT